MSAQQFWDLLTTAQASTALVLIAATLVYIAFKLPEVKKPSKSSK